MYNRKPRQKHLSSRIDIGPKLMDEIEQYKKKHKIRSARDAVEKLLKERLAQLKLSNNQSVVSLPADNSTNVSTLSE